MGPSYFYSVPSLGLEIVPNGVGLLLDADGHTTGEAFVQFANPTVAETARRERHMKKVKHRSVFEK